MAEELLKAKERFSGGISDYNTEGILDSYAFGRSVDVRSNPKQVTILPKTIKESGTVITDLPKWGEEYLNDESVYIYGNAGNIYKRTSAGTYSLLRTVPNSHGNGLVYSAEDDFLYYTSDKVIGRYGPLSGTPTFVDDFFGSQGGVPLNTNSLDLESSSSQYASRADTASLSITGDLSIDAQIKPESLPTSGNSMVLVSKWDESGTTRSYRFDINATSGYFGDGSDGALTISSNTTEAPIDSACTGTTGTYSLTATNASFAANQVILIHQTQGTGAGTWMRNTILSYTAGTITLVDPLNATYSTGAQVRVLKQHTDVTINSGITYTAKAWDGTVGGILSFIASGTVTITGTITASEKGFRAGGSRDTGTGQPASNATTGENNSGLQPAQRTPKVGGGGAGTYPSQVNSSGGGASYGGYGTDGVNGTAYGLKGELYGTADLTSLDLGSGGGGYTYGGKVPTSGSRGGGSVFIIGATITVTGAITCNGGNVTNVEVSGGAGSGGSILLKAQTATLGTSLITASGGTVTGGDLPGGNGGAGRIHLDYYTSYTGTTTPTLDATQDDNLVTNTTYRLRLLVSSTGSNSETLQKTFTPTVGTWQQVGVSWDASTSTATFYLNSVSLGTSVGTLTAIHDNASTFQVGMSKNGAGSAANFYDGLIDEVRVFNTLRSDSDFFNGLSTQIATNSTGLVAYYKFNGDYVDSTANANNLTSSGSPVFTTDVPYPSPTTRLDIDQSATTSGQVYTLATTISEGATHRKTFTPAKDPQKSISVLVAAVGTGDWTLTVHDSFNNTVASKTVTNSNMTTGYYEFIFSSVWRPLTNFTNAYHFHLTSTVADGTVTTTTVSDLETVSYRTYYQFLVEDTEWHPSQRFLNFVVFGNERHVAKYEAPLYEPNKVILGAGYKVRCFALWREYLAIGVTRGSNLNNQGRIYFWDGYSSTFNTFIEVPQGGVNAMLSSEGKLYIWAGSQQQQLVFMGGDTADKIKELPLIGTGESQVYPQGVTMWNSLIRFGVSGYSTSTDIIRAVYTYGSTNKRYPDILTCDYPISTTSTNSNVRIGLVMRTGSKMLIGWQDNVSYGIDYVLPTNSPFSTATIEFLIEDHGGIWKEKQITELVANFNPLLTGENINVKFKRDSDTTWITNTNDPSVGDENVRLITTMGRYNEMQAAVDLSTSVSTSPTLNGVLVVSNSNKTERRYG